MYLGGMWIEDEDVPTGSELAGLGGPVKPVAMCLRYEQHEDGTRTYCSRPVHGEDVPCEPYPYRTNPADWTDPF